MRADESLVPFSFDLNLPSILESGLKKGISNTDLLVNIFDKLRQGGRITVEFNVPAAIRAGLDSGEYIRKGGVIVRGQGRQSVVCWLKEGKCCVKIGKAVPSLIGLLMDVLSDVLLDIKLKEIQRQLSRIEDRIEANHSALVTNACDCLKHALGTQDEATRIEKLKESDRLFRQARHEDHGFLSRRLDRVHSSLRLAYHSKIRNIIELRNVFKELDELTDVTCRIAMFFDYESAIAERLSDTARAEGLRLEKLNFQLAVCEYLTAVLCGPFRSTPEDRCHHYKPYGQTQLVLEKNLDGSRLYLFGGLLGESKSLTGLRVGFHHSHLFDVIPTPSLYCKPPDELVAKNDTLLDQLGEVEKQLILSTFYASSGRRRVKMRRAIDRK